jgi:hypothetical protein
MHLFIWARTPAADSQVNIEYVLLDAANATVGTKFDAYSLTTGVVTRKYQQFPLVSRTHKIYLYASLAGGDDPR